MSRFCVIAGTKITLNGGKSLPIEQIKAGEEVLSFDLNTLQRSQKYDVLVKLKTNNFSGIIKKDYVKNIWKNTADEYFAINDRLKITGDHIVLAKRNNTYYWTKVFNLKIGDYLFTEFNIFEKIETIILIKERVKVFNLEVNSIYNYFANSYLIHNGQPCSACNACGTTPVGSISELEPIFGSSSSFKGFPARGPFAVTATGPSGYHLGYVPTNTSTWTSSTNSSLGNSNSDAPSPPRGNIDQHPTTINPWLGRGFPFIHNRDYNLMNADTSNTLEHPVSAYGTVQVPSSSADGAVIRLNGATSTLLRWEHDSNGIGTTFRNMNVVRYSTHYLRDGGDGYAVGDVVFATAGNSPNGGGVVVLQDTGPNWDDDDNVVKLHEETSDSTPNYRHQGFKVIHIRFPATEWRFEESLYKMNGGSGNDEKYPVLINQGYGNRGGTLSGAPSSSAPTAHSDNRGGDFDDGDGDVIFWVESGRKLVTYNITGGWSASLSSYNMNNTGLNTIYLTNKPASSVPNIIFSNAGTPDHSDFDPTPEDSNGLSDPSVWYTSSSVLPGFSHQESTILGFSLDEFWWNSSNTDETNDGFSHLSIRKRVVIGLKNSFSYLDPYGDKMCTPVNVDNPQTSFVPRNNSASETSLHHDGSSSVLWMQLTGITSFPNDIKDNNVIGLPDTSTETTYHNGGGTTQGDAYTHETGYNLSGYRGAGSTTTYPLASLSNGASNSAGNYIIGNGKGSGMDLIFEVTYYPEDTNRSFAPAEHQKLRVLLHKRGDSHDGVTETSRKGYINMFSNATNCTLGDIAADIATDTSNSNTLKQRHYVLPKYYRRSVSGRSDENILNTNWTFLVRDSTSRTPANSFAISLKSYDL